MAAINISRANDSAGLQRHRYTRKCPGKCIKIKCKKKKEDERESLRRRDNDHNDDPSDGAVKTWKKGRKCLGQVMAIRKF